MVSSVKDEEKWPLDGVLGVKEIVSSNRRLLKRRSGKTGKT